MSFLGIVLVLVEAMLFLLQIYLLIIMIMKTFDLALSMGSMNVSYVPTTQLGSLDSAPNFYSDLAWYEIDGELVWFGSANVVAPIGGKFLTRFEYSFLGGTGGEFGFDQELTKWVAWEPLVGKYYREGYATLHLTLEK